jgi:hypothetical protein
MTRHLPIRLAVALVGIGLALTAAPSWGAPQASAAPTTASAPQAGQKPPAAKPVPAPATPPAAKPVPAPATPPAPDGYSYRAEGRRDPFVSLLNRGTDPRQRKAEGVAGMLAGDAVLRGVLQNRGTYLAIVEGPDGKRQYIVHQNDRFADGVVKAITADGMLILQEVNDPLSLTKQREIRKTLRAVEEVK